MSTLFLKTLADGAHVPLKRNGEYYTNFAPSTSISALYLIQILHAWPSTKTASPNIHEITYKKADKHMQKEQTREQEETSASDRWRELKG